ncbi:MAG: tetratricopeptide repeat protein [Lachnospiraceae bacterium]|nr:tetratricopeptide repeat protein [Lachnospiraceae bacterium]
MDIARRCFYISNSYYNKGLKSAREKNLTDATENLKKALQFNKRNIDARNLLGLIYYHIGEASDALVQWVLSLNMQPQNNDADRFLNEVQRQSGLLDSYEQAIIKFNQALELAQNGTDDLAILQLAKIAETHKSYMRAHLLLGLLYMETGDYPKAYRSFQNVIRIDRGNLLALRCIEELRSYQKSSKGSKKSITKVINPEKAKEDSDIIIPEPYKEHQALLTAGNVLIGLLIGIASVVFIYLPVKEAAISREYNKQVINVSQQLSGANNELKQKEEEESSIHEEMARIQDQMDSINDVNDEKRLNMQILMGSIRAYDAGKIEESAKLFAEINPDLIEDVSEAEDESGVSIPSPVAYYNELKTYFDDDGYVAITHNGDKFYEDQDYQSAMDCYDLSISVHPNNPVAIYKKGLCYFQMGDRKKANEMFTEVIDNYPDHDVAEMARKERGV